MHETEIKLISYTPTGLDELAQPIETRQETSVLAIEVPVTRSEFYSASQSGIRPEYEFIVNPAEYAGQEEIEITVNSEALCLEVYRIFEVNPDQLEIYCRRAAGLNRRDRHESN